MQTFPRIPPSKATHLRHLKEDRAVRQRSLRNTLRRETVEYNRQRTQLIKASKIARREDRLLGLLAPRRDVGEGAAQWGTLPAKQLKPPRKMEDEQRAWGIRKGDRVCVVGAKERERGRIGVVQSVDETNQSVVIEGLNKADFPTPPEDLVYDREQDPVRTHEAPLPLSSVRLVYPLIDPTTKRKTDTIIDSLKLAGGKRYIAGTETQIKWPAEPAPPEAKEHDVDTLRIDVEDQTWTPKLLSVPFPETVIDELRNKHGRYRTRHEDSYLEDRRQRIEEAKATEERKRAGMMTPMEEWALLKKKEAEQREEPVLSETMLERIGRVIAKNKGLNVEGGEQGVRV